MEMVIYQLRVKIIFMNYYRSKYKITDEKGKYYYKI